MLDLNDNLYNARHRRDQPKLKRWKYAGLMLTYKCTAACQFCYYYCSPKAGGLMSTETALNAWKSLIAISGAGARVHITGGEPFLYFDRMLDILKSAQNEGLAGLDYIETNGSWAACDKNVTEKIRLLNDRGMNRLKISWDPFHEEFVRIDRVKRLISIARDILDHENVLVRWEKHLDHPTGIADMNPDQKKHIYRQALDTDSCRFTGRASDLLAEMSATHPPEYFQNKNCKNALLASKGVHIDPAGNVFNGQCSGMIVGNVHEKPLHELWKSFEPDTQPFWKTLYHHGPAGFIDQAVADGYQLRSAYASKCHLCADIRRFFFDKRLNWPIIGPLECYSR
ncbi:MAG: radical SAM protein [Planctomycetota bacterium]|jgi:MoaA/NifB/PqqE/SkfB family radical SAM enzyme